MAGGEMKTDKSQALCDLEWGIAQLRHLLATVGPGTFGAYDRVVVALESGQQGLLDALAAMERERDEERTKRLVAENARTLSLLGRSSEQELREDNLRIALAEEQVAREAADARYEALARTVREWQEAQKRLEASRSEGTWNDRHRYLREAESALLALDVQESS